MGQQIASAAPCPRGSDDGVDLPGQAQGAPSRPVQDELDLAAVDGLGPGFDDDLLAANRAAKRPS